MIRIYTISLWLIISLVAGSAWADIGKGPLRAANQFPPHLMFLRPVPDSPRLVPKGELNFSLSEDYCSIFVNETSAKWAALIDMEMAVLNLSFEYGLASYLTLSADIPIVSMSGGFLDGFLEDYHDTLGVPNYGREGRPRDEFAYELKKDGRNWFQAESGGFHLGETIISAKVPLLDEKHTGFLSAGLSYTLKIPTGDEDSGFGSGGFDHGLFLLSRSRFSSFLFYLNPGVIFLSDPETNGADISANNIFGLFAGGEYLYSDTLSLSVQLNCYTSPFEGTGISALDDHTLELGLGFTCQISPSVALEFAFSEDLTYASPDFNVHLRLIFED